MEGSMLKPRDTTLRTAKYVLSYMAKPLVVAFAPPAYVLHLGSSASPMFLGKSVASKLSFCFSGPAVRLHIICKPRPIAGPPLPSSLA